MDNKEEIFNHLYETYFDNVLRMCNGYVNGDFETASDLAQDAFVKVWQNMDKFEGKAKISTWIYRIAINTCLLYKRNSKIESKAIAKQVLYDSQDEDLQEFKLNKMFAAINTLSLQNKSIILLELESLPQKEIAEIMGMSHSAIRVRILRIKEKLSKLVKK